MVPLFGTEFSANDANVTDQKEEGHDHDCFAQGLGELAIVDIKGRLPVDRFFMNGGLLGDVCSFGRGQAELASVKLGAKGGDVSC